MYPSKLGQGSLSKIVFWLAEVTEAWFLLQRCRTPVLLGNVSHCYYFVVNNSEAVPYVLCCSLNWEDCFYYVFGVKTDDVHIHGQMFTILIWVQNDIYLFIFLLLRVFYLMVLAPSSFHGRYVNKGLPLFHRVQDFLTRSHLKSLCMPDHLTCGTRYFLRGSALQYNCGTIKNCIHNVHTHIPWIHKLVTRQ